VMHTLLNDLRYAARMLAKTPGFTAVAVAALALGIGSTTAVFSVVQPFLAPVVPFERPPELVILYGSNPRDPFEMRWLSAADFVTYRDQTKSFSSMALLAWPQGMNLSGGDEPVIVRGARVSVELFGVLGTPARIGRGFLPEDARPDAPPVAVLSHRLWQERFGGNREALGGAVKLNDRMYTIVGVMPQRMDFPGGAELWVPITPSAVHSAPQQNFAAIARLRPGAGIEQAQCEMQVLAAQLAEAHPETNAGTTVITRSLVDWMTADFAGLPVVLLGAVGFVLLIACANVANLLLARAATRQREMAVRVAMGAGRGQLVRLLLTESLLLAALGLSAGLLFAAWAMEAVRASLPDLARLPEPEWNTPVLAFALGATLLTVVLFGLAPALAASKVDLTQSLQEGAARSGSRRSRRLRNALVAGEVGLAVILLAGAGVTLRSLVNFRSIELGFNPENVTSMWVNLPSYKYAHPSEERAFAESVMERLRAFPAAEAVAATTRINLPADRDTGQRITVPGYTHAPGDEEIVHTAQAITPDFFRVLQIPVLHGRGFTAADQASNGGAAIVNERLARKFWPEQDPLGRTLKLGGPQSENPWLTVVGVVRDVVHPAWYELSEETLDVYLQAGSGSLRSIEFLVRVAPGATLPGSALRDAVWAVDREQPILRVSTMPEIIDRESFGQRAIASLLGTFAGTALLLAALGLYGLLAYVVVQRTQEIGVRMALGAMPRDVLRLVVSSGLKLALAGCVIGLAGAVALTRLLESVLYNVSGVDPLTFVLVPLVLLSVALAACLAPARRAMRVDPMVALRHE